MPEEVQVKNYHIIFREKPLTTNKKYQIDIRAVSEKDAIEEALSVIGSKHRMPRKLLEVQNVKIIDNKDIKNPILREIASDDKVKI